MSTPDTSGQRISFKLLAIDWQRVFPRTKLDQERVAFMAERYLDGGLEALPPIEVVLDPSQGKYVVADGHHRLFAAQTAGFDHILVVSPPIGGERAAVASAYELGLRAAARSGKPLSRSEQRDAILRLLDESPDRSDADIAALVGVTRQTVWRWRRTATANGTEPAGGERWATASVSAAEIAQQLVARIDRLWEARGLSDLLLGDLTGRRLAAALRAHYGDDAEEWAQRFAGWAQTALDELGRAE
jgi:ParB-like chromosome segregation protein Spo0J